MLSSNANLLITGGTFVTYINENKEFDILHGHIASSAFHDSGERFNPPRCHPQTRSVLLSEIMDWVTNDTSRTSFILWLYGAAGSGKTALAQTIADLCDAKGLLGASFFFSKESPERNHSKRLASTIAYQLALTLPDTRPYIEGAVRRDPSIFDRALKTQMQRLITSPIRQAQAVVTCQKDTASLSSLSSPILIIIDALDECDDAKVQRYILDIIDEEYGSEEGPLPVLFIITSRPDEPIRMRFGARHLSCLSLCISLEDYIETRDDVQTYLQLKFKEIKDQHPFRAYLPSSWPSEEIMNILLTKSSGQFVYAAMVIDYISSIYHRPTDRLDIVLGLLKDDDGDPPFSELDAIFSQILSSVFNLTKALRILGAILLTSTPFSPEVVESLLFLKPGDVPMYLGGLASLIVFNDPRRSIKVLHGSLSDFIFDEKRSGRFYIPVGVAHADIAVCCLRHLQTPKLPLLVDYACYNFETHLDAAAPTEELRQELLDFKLSSFYRSAVELSKTERYRIDPTVTLEDIWYFIPTFFDCVQNCVLYSDAEDIYEKQLESLDNFLDAELDRYSVDDRLLDLVALLPVYSSPISIQGDLDDVPLLKDAILGLKDAEHLILIDESSLNLRNMIRRHSQSEPFIELLCEYLEDPDRSVTHFIDGTRLAKTAVRCLKRTITKFSSEGCATDKASLMWILECIPMLLLNASHDDDLQALLKSFQIPLNKMPYRPETLRNIEESRLAYIIETTFNGKPAETASDFDHNHGLHIVPQGLKIYQGKSQQHSTADSTMLDPFSKFEREYENIHRRFCCVNSLLVGYATTQRKEQFRKSDAAGTAPYIILPVDDPFPEIASELIGVTDNPRSATMAGVMNIMIYRSWKNILKISTP